MSRHEIWDNPFQAAASEYKSQFINPRTPSKPCYIAPPIEYMFEENGEYWYRLCNGNQILVEKYNAVWHPSKIPVLPKNTKGENPDKRKV